MRLHEFRCPIHGFIRLDDDERALVDSVPFQRLRQIHQLALTWLVYPGATHRRFEHSLGVAELAGRVYDVVTARANLHPDVAGIVPAVGSDEHSYWRRALRLAALAHDLGHLPFSHAAEHQLLPPGIDHESLTIALIEAEPLASLWPRMNPAIDPGDIIKLAVGPKKLGATGFTAWQALLADIITGAAFGVDRMDYLLRDSWHAGVSYGVFDRARLVDTLRILPLGEDGRPALGLEAGGLPSAEALMLARQFTYRQVYFHPIRRIYDIHLQEFLSAWLPGGQFPTDPAGHLVLTDAEVITALRAIARDPAHPAHDPARIISDRQHFKRLYAGADGGPPAIWLKPEAIARFGEAAIRHDEYRQSSGAPDFPVLADGRVLSSLSVSHTLRHIPALAGDALFVDRAVAAEARAWLAERLG